jgi:hypothetical protein
VGLSVVPGLMASSQWSTVGEVTCIVVVHNDRLGSSAERATFGRFEFNERELISIACTMLSARTTGACRWLRMAGERVEQCSDNCIFTVILNQLAGPKVSGKYKSQCMKLIKGTRLPKCSVFLAYCTWT